MELICKNLTVSEQGELYFCGRSTASLAARYGTPLYLMDEDRIREKMRTYRRAGEKAFGAEKSRTLYAGKACSFKEMARITAQEGLYLDCVSAGEIQTALAAGFPAEKIYFHGNNKTDEDINFAIESGIGAFVVDCTEEVAAIAKFAGEAGKKQKILLRITPGIDTHTYEAVNTGKVDSKFGSAIETGQAKEICGLALSFPSIELMGFHCHVGSQVFDSDVFLRSAEIMLNFLSEMKGAFGYVAKELDLGGGYGVRYLAEEQAPDLEKNILQVGEFVTKRCRELGLEMPVILLEPGRSIVADAGLTLYRVGSVKTIPGYKNYVSVDGGMGDNPRYALYGSRYTVYCAGKMNEKCDFLCDVAGRCCESGDIIQPKVLLPASVCRGDLLAVCTTGAYNYSMASNYNRIPRPPVVMLSEKEERLVVRRETAEDLLRFDL